MILNKKLPVCAFAVTVVAAIIAIAVVTQQATVALKDIRRVGVSIAEIGKDYCGVAKHQAQRETEGWQIYQNKEFGVEIKYPADFLTGEPEIIGGNCDYQIFPEKCPNIDDILVKNNLESRENLQYPNYWSIKPVKANAHFNGIDFCLYSTNDAAAGTMYQANYYTTVKNNQCVILRLVVPYPNCGNYADEAGISRCEQDNLDKPQTVDQILSTFKFVK